MTDCVFQKRRMIHVTGPQSTVYYMSRANVEQYSSAGRTTEWLKPPKNPASLGVLFSVLSEFAEKRGDKDRE